MDGSDLKESSTPFDRLAEQYDRWFDSPEGSAIFAAEADCLRELMVHRGPNWLLRPAAC